MIKKEYKKKLWKEYLDHRDIFAEEQKALLMEWGLLFREDVSFLSRMWECLANHGGAMEDGKTGTRYELEGEYHILRWDAAELALRERDMKILLTDMIGLFEEILPLGSVVDLKREYLRQSMELSSVKQVRMVITKRFIGGAEGCYFPYAAAIYPIGMGGLQKSFCFTPALIEKVVFTGYCDAAEEAFVYQMKHQLIVEQKRKSVGFASKEECRAMNELFGRWEAGNE